ncbi:MAG: hypothetical protein RH942_13440 [Kiloniellaceae bacterium]
MRLSELQTQQVQQQTGADVIPDDNPTVPALRQNFGDHTFFIDTEGLHIWESVDEDPADGAKLVGVRIASWSDDEKKSLVPHDPAPSHILDPSNSDN